MHEGLKHKFISSSRLIAAVRALSYDGQYRICYAFYDEIIKYPLGIITDSDRCSISTMRASIQICLMKIY